jgi:T4 RnlA family RNA ligase
MFYDFPFINHIDDVLPSVTDDFYVAEKEGYKVISYVLQKDGMFPPVIVHEEDLDNIYDQAHANRREFRGIIFGADGRVLSRRYHKFFNLNERLEVLGENIDWSVPHVVLEKLDGSMISPIRLDGCIRLTTKAGITDISKMAEVWCARGNRHYLEFMDWVTKDGFTPIFEFCSRRNRVVIDHPLERLVLTAIRSNLTGGYMHHKEMQDLAISYNIECVKAYPIEVLAHAHEETNTEGYVIRFDNGHMLKVKTEWYLQIHRAKENLIWEKNIIKMIIDGHTDDVKPFLLEDDRNKLVDFETKVIDGLNKTAADISNIFRDIRQSEMDRKTYALTVMPKHPQVYSSIIFACWTNDKMDVFEQLCEHVRNHMVSQNKVDKSRPLWGGHKWDYGYGE